MKRLLIALVIIGVIAVTVYMLLGNSNSNKPAAPEPEPLTAGHNSGAFTASYRQLLNTYFSLKDALVAGDSVKANAAAAELATATDSLKVDEIESDSTGTIKDITRMFASTINGSALGLQGETTMEAKRREFQMISGALWDLTRTVKYDGQKIYKIHCPMAFDNNGAEWLNSSTEVLNPYFGQKMLHCGSVQDSLDYAKK